MFTRKDFSPADPNESEPYTFEFARDLDEGEIIVGVEWEIAVAEDSEGEDESPEDHITSVPTYEGTRTSQFVDNLLPGVKYVLTARVATSGGKTISLWSHVECREPA